MAYWQKTCDNWNNTTLYTTLIQIKMAESLASYEWRQCVPFCPCLFSRLLSWSFLLAIFSSRKRLSTRCTSSGNRACRAGATTAASWWSSYKWGRCSYRCHLCRWGPPAKASVFSRIFAMHVGFLKFFLSKPFHRPATQTDRRKDRPTNALS